MGVCVEKNFLPPTAVADPNALALVDLSAQPPTEAQIPSSLKGAESAINLRISVPPLEEGDGREIQVLPLSGENQMEGPRMGWDGQLECWLGPGKLVEVSDEKDGYWSLGQITVVNWKMGEAKVMLLRNTKDIKTVLWRSGYHKIDTIILNNNNNKAKVDDDNIFEVDDFVSACLFNLGPVGNYVCRVLRIKGQQLFVCIENLKNICRWIHIRRNHVKHCAPYPHQIDPELLVKKSSAALASVASSVGLDLDLVCSLCGMIPMLAVSPMDDISCCGNVFCAECLGQWSDQCRSLGKPFTCPTCRAGATSFQECGLAMKKISGLEVKCLYSGCNHTMSIGKFGVRWWEHIVSCDYRTVQCPDCRDPVIAGRWSHHWTHECPKRITHLDQLDSIQPFSEETKKVAPRHRRIISTTPHPNMNPREVVFTNVVYNLQQISNTYQKHHTQQVFTFQ
jgi:hypothetical protein